MKRQQQGVAVVEFALVLPMMLMMTCIATEFGRAYYQYNTITKSVREAVRYLTVRAPGVDIDKAKNIVVYGNAAGTGAPLAPGLSVSNVNIPARGTTGSYPTISTVSVVVTGYTFVPMVTNAFGLAFKNITFGPIRATMRSQS
jgi:Flp pilus assembly protein TadG